MPDARVDDARLDLGRDRGSVFERTIAPRKGDLPVVVEILRGENADSVIVHRMCDGALGRHVDVAAKIDAPDLGDEKRVQLPNGQILRHVHERCFHWRDFCCVYCNGSAAKNRWSGLRGRRIDALCHRR